MLSAFRNQEVETDYSPTFLVKSAVNQISYINSTKKTLILTEIPCVELETFFSSDQASLFDFICITCMNIEPFEEFYEGYFNILPNDIPKFLVYTSKEALPADFDEEGSLRVHDKVELKTKDLRGFFRCIKTLIESP